jgi:hypothetical protein
MPGCPDSNSSAWSKGPSWPSRGPASEAQFRSAPSAIATPALVDELTAERERIDRTITELISSREVLSQVIDAAAATEH